MYQDEMWIGTMLNGEARWVLTRTTETVEEARNRHQTSPLATAALGRALTGNLLLASSLKERESITLRFLGDGPLGGIITVGNAMGEVRGYVQEPGVELELLAPGKLDVASAVGQGKVVVSRSLLNGEVHNGMVSIVSGEIAEDLVHYLLTSEQIPSAMLLGVLVEKDLHVAGSVGLLIQPLPGAPEEAIQAIETRLSQLSSVSSLAAKSTSMEELASMLMGDLPYHLLERRPVRFTCHCSKERLGETLISLGYEELEDLAEAGNAEMVCHFCNEHYEFAREDLVELLETLK